MWDIKEDWGNKATQSHCSRKCENFACGLYKKLYFCMFAAFICLTTPGNGKKTRGVTKIPWGGKFSISGP